MPVTKERKKRYKIKPRKLNLPNSYYNIPSQEYDFTGCLRLVGKVINTMISEYENKRGKARLDAEYFLFKNNKLEDFLRRFHIDEYVSAAYIRIQIKRGAVSFKIQFAGYKYQEEEDVD